MGSLLCGSRAFVDRAHRFRKMFGGESFFVGRFTHPDGGSVTIAPRLPGTVTHRQMNGDSVFLTAGAFLACTPGLTVKAEFGGLRALFSGEGAFLVKVSGTGELFYNAYGGVVEQTVAGKFTVDTGHLVAFEPSLQYTIGGMGNLKSTFLSGEGLVIKFQGNGKVWVQTHTLDGLAGATAGRLVAVFEPRSNTMRAGVHAATLAASFASADRVFVYADGLDWSPETVFAEHKTGVASATDIETLIDDIAAVVQAGDTIVIMSNGGFGGIHSKLLEALAG